MKVTKLSIVAAMLVGSTLSAFDYEVDALAKLWYQTSDFSGSGASQAQKDADLFDKGGGSKALNSLGNASLLVGAKASVNDDLKIGGSIYGLSTLGLDGNLVSATPSNKVGMHAEDKATDDQWWARELWLAYTMSNTTLKVGRQELNTPLLFTEKWNVVDNTFNAALLINNDIPDTTLIGAFVGKSNGVAGGSTVAFDGEFNSFANHGAVAVGAINKSIPNTNLQAWYYSITSAAKAFWLQGDTSQLDKTIDLGVQFAHLKPSVDDFKGAGDDGKKGTSIGAVKAAINVADSTFYAAFSKAGKGENNTNFSNAATDDKSNIYTALGSIWLDGEHTTKSDTKAWKVGASTKLVPYVTLSTSYGQAKQGNNGDRRDLSERNEYSAFDLIASTGYKAFGFTAIYNNYVIKYLNGGNGGNALDGDKLKTNTIRFIASLKF